MHADPIGLRATVFSCPWKMPWDEMLRKVEHNWLLVVYRCLRTKVDTVREGNRTLEVYAQLSYAFELLVIDAEKCMFDACQDETSRMLIVPAIDRLTSTHLHLRSQHPYLQRASRTPIWMTSHATVGCISRWLLTAGRLDIVV